MQVLGPALVRRMSSDHIDPLEVADDWSARLKHALEHVPDVRGASDYPEAIFMDVLFPDFAADQFAVIEQIYQAFGRPMSAEEAAAMREYIRDNPKGKHGVHAYTPEEYGIRPDAVRQSFHHYIDRFDLQPE
jgi:hypothetical protein